MSRLLCCHSVLILLAASILWVPSLLAQDKTVHPTKADLAKFGQLPVRFNGRVTTYDVVARNYLRHLSDREVCIDDDGTEHAAVRWLLDVMAASENRDDWRIFPIENVRLLEQLELKTAERGEANRNHFSMNELRSKFGWLQEKNRELEQIPTKLEADEMAILFLYEKIEHTLVLAAGFLPLPPVNRENTEAVIDRLMFIGQYAAPLFVFSEEEKEWRSLPRANLESLAARDAKPQNPLFLELQALLKAFREQDFQAFRQGLALYAELLKTAKASNGPFAMFPSKDWVERGVPPAQMHYFYGDADAYGHKIVDMVLAGTTSQFLVNYFPGEDASPVVLQNSWRIMLGLAPLSEADAKATWKPFEVAGHRAILMDDATPDGIDIPFPRRFLTVVLKVEGQTFVFAWSGKKDIIAGNMKEFHQLMRSIQLKSPKELAAWFRGEEPSEPPYPERLLGAVVPDGKQMWAFATSGPDQAIQSHREKFHLFLKTLLINANAERTELDWQLPEGWSKFGDFGGTTLILGRGQNELPMTILPLGDVRDDSVPVLVNHWATKLGMDPLPEKVRKDAIKEITIAGRKAFFIELQKPGEIVKDAEIAYQAPNGWKPLPKSPFVQESFEITKGESSAKLTIASLPANNNLVANINRWRAQLELPMQTEEDIQKNVKDLAVDNQPGKLVEIHNTDTKQRILAAVVTSGEKDWFFKLMGDAAVIEQERQAFEEFLKTVKFATKAETKTEEEKP